MGRSFELQTNRLTFDSWQFASSFFKISENNSSFASVKCDDVDDIAGDQFSRNGLDLRWRSTYSGQLKKIPLVDFIISNGRFFDTSLSWRYIHTYCMSTCTYVHIQTYSKVYSRTYVFMYIHMYVVWKFVGMKCIANENLKLAIVRKRGSSYSIVVLWWQIVLYSLFPCERD
jgi:hypothetical protein